MEVKASMAHEWVPTLSAMESNFANFMGQNFGVGDREASLLASLSNKRHYRAAHSALGQWENG